MKMKPNPIIQLNLAIIQSKTKGIAASLSSLRELEANKVLKEYHLLPATQGVFYMKNGDFKKAIDYFKTALQMKPSFRESDLIKNMIKQCINSLNKN